MIKDKIRDKNELKGILAPLREAGKRVVFTNGCFDILHLGHIRYLEKARGYGDLLVVGVNTDQSIRRLKGENRPLYSQAERTEILAALEVVDWVTLFDEDDPRVLISELKPDVLVKGGDYQIEEILGREIVWRQGGEVKAVPLEPGFSTSALINTILERFVDG